MKKLLFIAFAMLGAVSCNNPNQAEEPQAETLSLENFDIAKLNGKFFDITEDVCCLIEGKVVCIESYKYYTENYDGVDSEYIRFLEMPNIEVYMWGTIAYTGYPIDCFARTNLTYDANTHEITIKHAGIWKFDKDMGLYSSPIVADYSNEGITIYCQNRSLNKKFKDYDNCFSRIILVPASESAVQNMKDNFVEMPEWY